MTNSAGTWVNVGERLPPSRGLERPWMDVSERVPVWDERQSRVTEGWYNFDEKCWYRIGRESSINVQWWLDVVPPPKEKETSNA